jgi:hypothetical protein
MPGCIVLNFGFFFTFKQQLKSNSFFFTKLTCTISASLLRKKNKVKKKQASKADL